MIWEGSSTKSQATDDPEVLGQKITNAGAIFQGRYTPEAIGDYVAGTNHVLPTYGYARNYSGLSLDQFVKTITFQTLTAEGLQTIGPAVETLAEVEQLTAHKNAVSIRLQQLTKAER